MKEAITSAEIGEQSFGYPGFVFFAHEYLILIAHLLDLEDGLLRLLVM